MSNSGNFYQRDTAKETKEHAILDKMRIFLQALINIAKVLCMPRFMMSWPYMLMVSSTSLLRLQNEQLVMYCHCFSVKFFFFCLLTNKSLQKREVSIANFQSGRDSTNKS